MTQPAHIKYAEAEKAYSEHLKDGCLGLQRGAPYVCPIRAVRNIAYLNYTHHIHPSLLKGGSR